MPQKIVIKSVPWIGKKILPRSYRKICHPAAGQLHFSRRVDIRGDGVSALLSHHIWMFIPPAIEGEYKYLQGSKCNSHPDKKPWIRP
jgi:hypothetical protein